MTLPMYMTQQLTLLMQLRLLLRLYFWSCGFASLFFKKSAKSSIPSNILWSSVVVIVRLKAHPDRMSTKVLGSLPGALFFHLMTKDLSQCKCLLPLVFINGPDFSLELHHSSFNHCLLSISKLNAIGTLLHSLPPPSPPPQQWTPIMSSNVLHLSKWCNTLLRPSPFWFLSHPPLHHVQSICKSAILEDTNSNLFPESFASYSYHQSPSNSAEVSHLDHCNSSLKISQLLFFLPAHSSQAKLLKK